VSITRSADKAAARAKPALLAPAIGIAAATAIAAPVAFLAMFSGFQDYDDEGYMLIVLREYARGGRLYDEVYSQYGPAYHQAVSTLFRLLSLDFTHEHGRAVVLVLWLAVAAVCATLTYRLTRNVVITACTQIVVLLALVPLRDEPLHPGEPLALLVAGAVLAGSFVTVPGWCGPAAGAIVGILLGTAVLTKINVGAFAAVSTVFALLGAMPRTPLYRTGRAIAAMVFLLVSPALLGPSAAHPDVRAYLAVMIASTLGIALAGMGRDGASSDARPAMAALGVAFLGSLSLSGAWELWRGTSWLGLLDGIVLAPARHPVGFLEPPQLGPWAIPYAALWLTLALVAAFRGPGGSPASRVVAGLRGPTSVVIGVAIWLAAADGHWLNPLAIGPPAFWLALTGPSDAPGSVVGRHLLVATAALQTLHAFPVGGSQVAFGAFLGAPVGALLVSDGWRSTASALAAKRGWDQRRIRLAQTMLGATLMAGALGGVAITARRFIVEYVTGVPLGLPGAERIRVPVAQAALYHRLTNSLVQHCATFVSQPGFNSLYLFTRMEPPTRRNGTAWMLLFDDATQLGIVDRLTRMTGPICAVRRQRVARPWRTPLAQYIDEHFATIYSQDYFEFMLPRADGEPAGVPAQPSPPGARP
jgi:hypothetical protein